MRPADCADAAVEPRRSANARTESFWTILPAYRSQRSVRWPRAPNRAALSNPDRSAPAALPELSSNLRFRYGRFPALLDGNTDFTWTKTRPGLRRSIGCHRPGLGFQATGNAHRGR